MFSVINDNKNNDENNWLYIFYPFYDQNENHWRVKLYPIYFIFLYLICLFPSRFVWAWRTLKQLSCYEKLVMYEIRTNHNFMWRCKNIFCWQTKKKPWRTWTTHGNGMDQQLTRKLIRRFTNWNFSLPFLGFFFGFLSLAIIFCRLPTLDEFTCCKNLSLNSVIAQMSWIFIRKWTGPCRRGLIELNLEWNEPKKPSANYIISNVYAQTYLNLRFRK